MIDKGKYNVLGVQLQAVDYESAVEQIVESAKSSDALGVSALAVHGLMTGALDSVHRFRLNSLELVVPDGQPVRWALNRLHGVELRDRVYGPTLMLKTCQRAADEGLPVFLYGTTSELLKRLKSNLMQSYPRLQIVGMQPSRFRCLTESERADVIAKIRGTGAAITFVGLGCPRQETWVYEMKHELSMPLIAVGAAFNFHAGALPQAPEFMQRYGLEWLFRLSNEPKRLWRRYCIYNPLFIGMLITQLMQLYDFNDCPTLEPTQLIRHG